MLDKKENGDPICVYGKIDSLLKNCKRRGTHSTDTNATCMSRTGWGASAFKNICRFEPPSTSNNIECLRAHLGQLSLDTDVLPIFPKTSSNNHICTDAIHTEQYNRNLQTSSISLHSSDSLSCLAFRCCCSRRINNSTPSSKSLYSST